MNKPAFSLKPKKKPDLSAADLAALERKAKVTAPPAAPATTEYPIYIPLVPPVRKPPARNTSLRLTDEQLALLTRVARGLPGIKSNQDLMIRILMPALERLAADLPG